MLISSIKDKGRCKGYEWLRDTACKIKVKRIE